MWLCGHVKQPLYVVEGAPLLCRAMCLTHVSCVTQGLDVMRNMDPSAFYLAASDTQGSSSSSSSSSSPALQIVDGAMVSRMVMLWLVTLWMMLQWCVGAEVLSCWCLVGWLWCHVKFEANFIKSSKLNSQRQAWQYAWKEGTPRK